MTPDKLRVEFRSALPGNLASDLGECSWLERGTSHILLASRAAVPITGCKDKRTERFLAGERVKAFETLAEAAVKALTKLQAAVALGDLRSPRADRFEAVGGDRQGQYSIRINRQYRVCFRWAPREPVPAGTDPLRAAGDAYDVEISDYH